MKVPVLKAGQENRSPGDGKCRYRMQIKPGVKYQLWHFSDGILGLVNSPNRSENQLLYQSNGNDKIYLMW